MGWVNRGCVGCGLGCTDLTGFVYVGGCALGSGCEGCGVG